MRAARTEAVEETRAGIKADVDGPQTASCREPEERVEMMQDLIRMMAADGQLAEIEKELFAAAAVKMSTRTVPARAIA